ncbi:hypothetical protein EPN44_05840 [bacterium]|nr:MAG: hypothetical protein EPN44_05840 [bacterium]
MATTRPRTHARLVALASSRTITALRHPWRIALKVAAQARRRDRPPGRHAIWRKRQETTRETTVDKDAAADSAR